MTVEAGHAEYVLTITAQKRRFRKRIGSAVLRTVAEAKPDTAKLDQCG